MENAMADPNNIPQQVEQLSESLNSSDNQTKEEAQEAKEAKAEVAKPEFDKEYDIAQQNNSESGTQSSDSNPVNRQSGEAGTGRSRSSTLGEATHSPGDSDPSDYLEMAKDVTKNVKSADAE